MDTVNCNLVSIPCNWWYAKAVGAPAEHAFTISVLSLLITFLGYQL